MSSDRFPFSKHHSFRLPLQMQSFCFRPLFGKHAEYDQLLPAGRCTDQHQQHASAMRITNMFLAGPAEIGNEPANDAMLSGNTKQVLLKRYQGGIDFDICYIKTSAHSMGGPASERHPAGQTGTAVVCWRSCAQSLQHSQLSKSLSAMHYPHPIAEMPPKCPQYPMSPRP